jgi:hypothetical protein
MWYCNSTAMTPRLIDVDSRQQYWTGKFKKNQNISCLHSRSKKKQDKALVSFCQLTPSQCLNLLFYATKINYGTGCLACAMLRINFFYINFFKKKRLKFKSFMFFFCKIISKSFESGYNTWLKSNIYNINNNIKLAWLKFRWVWLQHQTQKP